LETIATRRAILALVERYPGLHVRELARQASMSEALALYHLDQLAESEFIEAIDDGNYRRFYPRKGAPVEEDRELMGWLRRRVPLQIALLLLERPALTHQELTEALQLAKSTVSYHVTTLEGARFLERGPNDLIMLQNPRKVTRLLTRWEPPEDAVSRFGALWSRFYARRKKP
jgi:predicted transcriptional regulator